MKVLVTGATGFLGSHLSELLVEQGHEVKALIRKTSKTDFLETIGAQLHLASLETGAGLKEAVEDVDAVVHSAGLVKARTPEEFHEVNVLGTRRLLDATKAHRPNVKRFVQISSLAAHGFPEDGQPRRFDEDARPVTHYGRSKLDAEVEVLRDKDVLPITVIRPPAIYGPRDSEMFAFFQMISRRFAPFMGSADNQLSLIYGPDCARAIYLSLTEDHPSGSIYFVDDGRTYSQREFGAIVQDALGVKAWSFPLPIGLVSVAAVGSEFFGKIANKAMMLTRDKVNELRHPYLICSGPEIRQELGWQPEVQLEEGARRTADWYRQEGWL